MILHCIQIHRRVVLVCTIVCTFLLSSAALAQDAAREVIEIRSSGIELSYSLAEITVKAGEEITIRYINESETMPHNIVVVQTEEDIRPVGIAALKAHKTAYIPEEEKSRIIAYSELAQPGETIEFVFTAPPPGTYPYICTYSGHFTMMQGRLITTE